MALLKVTMVPKRGTYFQYKGNQVTISPVRFNPYLGADAWLIDLTWDEEGVTKGVYGIVLAAGVNLLKQHKAPIPSLYVLSSANSKSDIISIEDLKLFIKE